ncbi:hypothetical protein J6590_008699 [Homalodisca vitripennis]|nr:hypothetical protein J6590_008699 [Homalodisca vitripennis]
MQRIAWIIIDREADAPADSGRGSAAQRRACTRLIHQHKYSMESGASIDEQCRQIGDATRYRHGPVPVIECVSATVYFTPLSAPLLDSGLCPVSYRYFNNTGWYGYTVIKPNLL